MDPVHIHLFLNHVPVLGSVFATLLLAYALVRRSDDVARIAFFALASCAVLSIPVFLTGEPSEDIVENLAGVGGSFVEEHEESGKLAFWALMVTGVAAASAFFLSLNGRRGARAAAGLVLFIGIVWAGR